MEHQAPIDQLPALRTRRDQAMTESVNQVRRMLWRAYQHGELSAEEFLQTLERLEPSSEPQ